MADMAGAVLSGPVTAISDNVIYLDPQADPSGSAQDEAVRSAACYAASLAGLMKELAAEMEKFGAASQRQAELSGLAVSTREFADEVQRLSQNISQLPLESDGAG